MTGADLTAGMLTLQRAIDRDGNVKFIPDSILVEEIESVSCGVGIHFRTINGGQVCYYRNAIVFARKMSDAELKEAANGNRRKHRERSEMADNDSGTRTVGNKRRGTSGSTETSRRSRKSNDSSSSRVVHGKRS
jgi:hypothetical protein